MPIEGIEDVPYLQESGLDAVLVRVQMHGEAAAAVPEVGDEVLHRLALHFRQVAEIVLDVLVGYYIGKKVPGVYQILVDVVEIGQDDLSPEDELVQGLMFRVNGAIAVVEGQQQGNAPADRRPVHAAKEVVDGKRLRRHDGTARPLLPQQVPQVLPEEDRGPSVGENEAVVLDAGLQIVRGHLFQKRRFHTLLRFRLLQIYRFFS